MVIKGLCVVIEGLCVVIKDCAWLSRIVHCYQGLRIESSVEFPIYYNAFGAEVTHTVTFHLLYLYPSRKKTVWTALGR